MVRDMSHEGMTNKRTYDLKQSRRAHFSLRLWPKLRFILCTIIYIILICLIITRPPPAAGAIEEPPCRGASNSIFFPVSSRPNSIDCSVESSVVESSTTCRHHLFRSGPVRVKQQRQRASPAAFSLSRLHRDGGLRRALRILARSEMTVAPMTSLCRETGPPRGSRMLYLVHRGYPGPPEGRLQPASWAGRMRMW